MNPRTTRKILCLLALNTPVTAYASSQAEIDHLIEYVAFTECQYERNNTLHDGTEAVKHIQKKYAYFEDEIETAESFIRYAATKSELSGNYYQIHCPGESARKSQDWLLTELERYRAGHNN